MTQGSNLECFKTSRFTKFELLSSQFLWIVNMRIGLFVSTSSPSKQWLGSLRIFSLHKFNGSCVIIFLNYPSTLKWSIGREWSTTSMTFKTIVEFCNANCSLVVKPMPTVYIFGKWSSTVDVDCGTTTCKWINSSPKLRNWSCAIVGGSITVVDLWIDEIWQLD